MKTRLVDAASFDTASLLISLQKTILPGDAPLDPLTGHWWIVYDHESPVAFAALRDVPSFRGACYMARCGVLPKYRGMGLQRRLLTTRERKARSLGYSNVITTTLRNPASANNLIKRGYMTYEPQTRWGAVDTIYWIKSL